MVAISLESSPFGALFCFELHLVDGGKMKEFPGLSPYLSLFQCSNWRNVLVPSTIPSVVVFAGSKWDEGPWFYATYSNEFLLLFRSCSALLLRRATASVRRALPYYWRIHAVYGTIVHTAWHLVASKKLLKKAFLIGQLFNDPLVYFTQNVTHPHTPIEVAILI